MELWADRDPARPASGVGRSCKPAAVLNFVLREMLSTGGAENGCGLSLAGHLGRNVQWAFRIWGAM